MKVVNQALKGNIVVTYFCHLNTNQITYYDLINGLKLMNSYIAINYKYFQYIGLIYKFIKHSRYLSKIYSFVVMSMY